MPKDSRDTSVNPVKSNRSTPSRVFVSCPREDSDIASFICDHLETLGAQCSRSESIVPGKNWAKAITDSVHESQVFLVVFSKASKASSPCLSKEWQLIQQRVWEHDGSRICVLLLDSADPPPFLAQWNALRCKRTKSSLDDIVPVINQWLQRATLTSDSESKQKLRANTHKRFNEMLRALDECTAKDDEADAHD